MTVTAAAQAQAQPPQQQGQPQPQGDQHLVAVIVAALAAYSTAQALQRALAAPFRAAGIGGQSLAGVVALVASWPPDVIEGTGPATRWTIRQNTLRRAAFLLAAARRVQAAVASARAHGQPVIPAARAGLATEQRYMGLHIAAVTGRVQAATAVDGVAAIHGNLLGWLAVKDHRCTPGCAAASGKNFLADRPPIVEGHPAYPGMVHGATCRCVAVPAFKGARVLPSVLLPELAEAA